jgi:hypothetical protein
MAIGVSLSVVKWSGRGDIPTFPHSGNAKLSKGFSSNF